MSDHRFEASPECVALYERHYNSHGLSSDRQKGAIQKAQNIATLCRDVPHDAILEIGAGDGAVIRALADQGFGKTYFALDLSTAAIDLVKAQCGPSLKEAMAYDGYNIPYGADVFDLAVLSHVLEHLEYPRRLLFEAGRVARNIVVEVPLLHTIRLADDYVFDPVGHINSYSIATLRREAQTSGLEIVGQVMTTPEPAGSFHNAGAWLRWAIKRAAAGLAPRLAAAVFVYHYAILCRRTK